MKMREQMARAMCKSFHHDPDLVLAGPTFARLVNEPFWKTFLPATDAVLDALMDPETGVVVALFETDGGTLMRFRAAIKAIKEGA